LLINPGIIRNSRDGFDDQGSAVRHLPFLSLPVDKQLIAGIFSFKRTIPGKYCPRPFGYPKNRAFSVVPQERTAEWRPGTRVRCAGGTGLHKVGVIF
jgi:hypothetical protein